MATRADRVRTMTTPRGEGEDGAGVGGGDVGGGAAGVSRGIPSAAELGARFLDDGRAGEEEEEPRVRAAPKALVGTPVRSYIPPSADVTGGGGARARLPGQRSMSVVEPSSRAFDVAIRGALDDSALPRAERGKVLTGVKRLPPVRPEGEKSGVGSGAGAHAAPSGGGVGRMGSGEDAGAVDGKGGAGVSVDERALRVQTQRRILLENLRLSKWREMLGDWDSWVGNARRREQLKRRCRKGIPDAVRGLAWQQLLRVDERRASLRAHYEDLLRRPVHGRDQAVEAIERDICRTFPHHPLFAERGGIGQTALYKVLRAYAARDPDTGYCQGMGFIVAVLLSYMPEEEAFSTLTTIMELPPHKMRDLFAPGLPQVPLLEFQLDGLVRRFLPRLHAHFAKKRVAVSMFAAHWFLTVFTYNFPFRLVTRIWDAFLAEGWKVVFRVSIAILQQYEPQLLTLDFEGIMGFFRALPETLDDEIEPDQLMERAFKLRLKRAHLLQLANEYGVVAAKREEEERKRAAARKLKRDKIRAEKEARAKEEEEARGKEGKGAGERDGEGKTAAERERRTEGAAAGGGGGRDGEGDG